jgi:hypothetical protein
MQCEMPAELAVASPGMATSGAATRGTPGHLARSMDRVCLCFIAVSAMDAFLTWLLLTRHSGQIVESNPLALFCIERWGFTGMVLFKILLVSIVILNYTIIVRHREQLARRVMNFGVVVVDAVVLYSLFLLVSQGEMLKPIELVMTW